MSVRGAVGGAMTSPLCKKVSALTFCRICRSAGDVDDVFTCLLLLVSEPGVRIESNPTQVCKIKASCRVRKRGRESGDCLQVLRRGGKRPALARISADRARLHGLGLVPRFCVQV